MDSLQFDEEVEEQRFLDASDCCESLAPCDDEFGLSSSFDFGVWTRTPESVQQRRKKLYSQIGINSDEINQKEDVDRIMENSGAELRAPGFDHEFSSSPFSRSPTDDLSVSDESNSDIYGIENLNGVVNCSKIGLEKKPRSNTKKLFSILGSIKSIVYKKGLSKKLSPAKEAEVGRVKVHYCKKRLKELSALFTEQDIYAHKGSIFSMKFSPDGHYLATGGEDCIVRVWRVVEDTSLSKVDPSHFDPSCVYLRVNNSSELAPVISEKDRLVKLKRRNTGSVCVVFPPVIFRISEEPLHEFHGHSDEISDLSWSKDNSLLSASIDNTVRLWQVGYENCLKVFLHNNYVTCVQFNPVDENRFVSGSIDGKVRIWEISGCQVVGWTYIREIVTAVCYRPNGKGLVVGSMRGTCRYYDTADDFFHMEDQIDLHRKKKAQCKRITGFQFHPQDHDKLMVTCACSRVKILHGTNVIGKIKGNRSSGNQLLASFAPDGKHIVSTSNDANVYLYNCIDQFELSQPHPRKSTSWERFSANASIAIPWVGFRTMNSDTSINSVPLASPSRFSIQKELVLESFTKGCATWPEEKLVCPFMYTSDYKFLKKCQSITGPHAWNMVIIAAGRDGRIRSFHNYGLPVAL